MLKTRLNEGLLEKGVGICKKIAASREVVTACFYGPWVFGYAEEKSDIHILLVLNEYQPTLRGYFTSLNGGGVSTIAVDQKAFEKDVEQGWLGEFIAEKITTPYKSLINEEYLLRQETKLKKRIIWELLENIVLEFPELSRIH